MVTTTDRASGLPPVFAQFAAALADPREREQVVAALPGRGARGAAVLALFGPLEQGSAPSQPRPSRPRPASPAELTLTLIERSHTMRSHPGQIAFPGGAVDDTDTDVVHTALREAAEEIGLVADSVDVLGAVPPAYMQRSDFDVTTVVAWWRAPHPIGAGDPAEVHAVATVPLATLLDPANRLTSVHPSGHRGPAFLVDDLFVWGFTAHLLDGLFQLAGWGRTWDRGREQPVPARFMRDGAARR